MRSLLLLLCVCRREYKRCSLCSLLHTPCALLLLPLRLLTLLCIHTTPFTPFRARFNRCDTSSFHAASLAHADFIGIAQPAMHHVMLATQLHSPRSRHCGAHPRPSIRLSTW
jgi:hypothetical protein